MKARKRAWFGLSRGGARTKIGGTAALDDSLLRILRIAPHFAGSRGPGGVAGAVCKEAVDAFGCDVALLLTIVDDEHFAIEWREPPSSLIPPGKTLRVDELPDFREALHELRTTFEPDMPGQLGGEAAQLARRLGTRAAIRVPISVQGHARRVLVLQWLREVAEPDPQARVELQRFADQAGLALEHAARREAEERARRVADERQALLGVMESLSSARTVSEVAQALVSESIERTGAAAAAAFVRDGSSLRVAAVRGLEVAGPGEPVLTIDAVDALADAVRENELVLVESEEVRAARYPQRVVAPPGGPCEASASIPLIADDSAVGGVELTFRGERSFDTADRELLAMLGRQGGLALERALLLEVERERRFHAELLAAVISGLEAATDVQVLAQGLVDLLVPRLGEYAWAGGRDGEPVRAVAPADLDPERVAGAGARLTAQLDLAGDVAVELVVGRAEPYTEADAACLQEIAAHVAVRFENARLQAEERSIAYRLQRQLLPLRLPEIEGVQSAAHYQAGTALLHVGGDWYDVFERSPTRVCLTVGDVVGKGITAAGVMGRLRSAVRALALACDDPVEVVGQLERFAQTVDGAEFATLCYADLDIETGRLRYLHAGHPPALVVEPSGRARFLEDGRTSLLCVPIDEPRETGSVTLEPGSTLVLYSDGLVERRDASLGAALDNLQALMTSVAPLPTAELAAAIASGMTDGQSQTDDVVVLVVRFDGRP